jgi:hypothetical protein
MNDALRFGRGADGFPHLQSSRKPRHSQPKRENQDCYRAHVQTVPRDLPTESSSVANLQPRRMLRQIRSIPSLCNNAFEVILARKMKESFAIRVDVVAI